MAERDEISQAETLAEAQPDYSPNSTSCGDSSVSDTRQKWHNQARTSPSYKKFKASSERASTAARGASNKTDTRPEVLLRTELWRVGLRYRKNVASLPGKPDIVFSRARLVIFVDGDFWHGRNWPERRTKLLNGSNPDYWIRKIERNMERDAENAVKLQEQGWSIMRFWETDITSDLQHLVDVISRKVGSL